ncbi:maleylpyruvate isomerase N-terminal domain-containing protein [Streptomyces sp. NPDC004726]
MAEAVMWSGAALRACLDASVSQLQWIVDGYLLPLASARPTRPNRPMRNDPQLAFIADADRRAARTVEALSAADWSAPSVLPGWTRAHVVAHLALNGEGLARALDGLLSGRTVPVYASGEARDHDIEELAAQGPGELRQRLSTAAARFAEVARELTDAHWAGAVIRLPESPALTGFDPATTT